MNAQQKALLQSMQILIDSRLDKIGRNYYISGIITAIDDKGGCDVLCSDHTYTGVRVRNGLVLQVGDAVQVLIKNGDFNQKFIDDKLYYDPHYVGYSKVADSVAIGTINLFTAGAIPEGWLLCNGSAVSRAAYAELYAVIGTTFGAGDGATTFNVPDLRGRMAAGKDSSTDFSALGKTGGEKTHTLTTSEMPVHNHGYLAHYGVSTQRPASTHPWNLNDTDYNDYRTTNSGGGAAHNNLPPYLTVNYIIKAKDPVLNLSYTPSHIVDHLGSDCPTDVLSANMGRVLDKKLSDTKALSITHLTLNPGFAEQDNCCVYTKTAGMITVNFFVSTTNTFSAGNYIIIATLPSEYWPAYYAYSAAIQCANSDLSAPKACSTWIRPHNGKIVICTNNSSDKYFCGQIVYPQKQ